MARLTKKDLKAILKECLREILKEEGMIGGSTHSTQQIKTESNRTNISNTSVRHNPLLENVNLLAKVTGGKKSDLYAQILADTATTTLLAQKEPNMQGMTNLPEFYTEEQIASDSESIQQLTEQFSATGDMSHWAKLAFAKKDK